MLFNERNCCPDDMWQTGMTTPGGYPDECMPQAWDNDDYGYSPMIDDRSGCCPQPMCPTGPIMEQPIERCVQRNICHEVKHICPINTRIINNHICRHTYVPHYTCCEQNVVSNVSQGSCCDFV